MSTVNDHESFGKWCLDSGASSHMVGDRKKMVSTVKPTNSVSLNLASDTTTTIQGIGEFRISAPDDKIILLNKTLCTRATHQLDVRRENDERRT